MRRIQRLLIVEDCRGEAEALRLALADHAEVIEVAASAADARRQLEQACPEVMVLDFKLEDGNALDVLTAAACLPWTPTTIAISGEAGPDHTFELARLGVRAFLAKPFDTAALEAAIDRARAEPPDLGPHLRQTVGRRPVRDVEQAVRETMVGEALGRAAGSRRKAASLLSISRQLLQHILRNSQRLSTGHPASSTAHRTRRSAPE